MDGLEALVFIILLIAGGLFAFYSIISSLSKTITQEEKEIKKRRIELTKRIMNHELQKEQESKLILLEQQQAILSKTKINSFKERLFKAYTLAEKGFYNMEEYLATKEKLIEDIRDITLENDQKEIFLLELIDLKELNAIDLNDIDKIKTMIKYKVIK